MEKTFWTINSLCGASATPLLCTSSPTTNLLSPIFHYLFSSRLFSYFPSVKPETNAAVHSLKFYNSVAATLNCNLCSTAVVILKKLPVMH